MNRQELFKRRQCLPTRAAKSMHSDVGSRALSPALSPRRSVVNSFAVLSAFLLGTAACAAQVKDESAAMTGEIAYAYKLTTNSNERVCSHMNAVLNGQFRYFWALPFVMPGDAKSPYADGGSLAFPRLPGTVYDEAVTVQLSSTRVPSSSEFDAIRWQVGRVDVGGPTETIRSQPALVAILDIDNDGKKDTVVRYGFTRGYDAIVSGSGSEEYLLVLRGVERIDLAQSNITQLLQEGGDAGRVVSSSGRRLRLLMHEGRAHLARYDLQFAGDISELSEPYEIAGETMSIVELRYQGQKAKFTNREAWTESLVCEYAMIQLSQQN